MLLTRPADAVVLIRSRRRQLGMSQGELGDAIGASRAWVSKLERGGADTTEFGLILKAMQAVGLHVQALPSADAVAKPADVEGRPEGVNLDAIIEGLQRGRDGDR